MKKDSTIFDLPYKYLQIVHETKAIEERAKQANRSSVRVGLLTSFSGELAANESLVTKAALLAIEDINRLGLLGDCDCVPVLCDGQSDATAIAVEAKSALNNGIRFLFGTWASSSRKSVLTKIHQQNEEENQDPCLFYPVQYEGVERRSEYQVAFGALPNQSTFFAIDWLINERLNIEGRPPRVLVVGSNYVYPRLVSFQLHGRLKKEYDSSVNYYDIFADDVDVLSEKLVEAAKFFDDLKPDFILNLINGSLNRHLFGLLAKSQFREIATLSTSLTPFEIRNYERGVFDVGDNYLVSSYSPKTREGSFSQKFKNKWDELPCSEAAWNSYISLISWAFAYSSSESKSTNDVREVLANLKDFPSSEHHGVSLEQLELNQEQKLRMTEELHAFHMPKIFQLEPDNSTKLVTESDTWIPPDLYPGFGDLEEWFQYAESIHNAYDIVGRKVGEEDWAENVQRSILRQAEYLQPRHDKVSWASSIERNAKDFSTWKLFQGEKPHKIIDCWNERFSLSQIEELNANVREKLRGFNFSDTDLQRVWLESDPRVVCSKILAFCGRYRRIYLFDFLDHIISHFPNQEVIIDGETATRLTGLKQLMQDTIRFEIGSVNGCQNGIPFENTNWEPGSAPTDDGSLKHYVRLEEHSVKYAMVLSCSRRGGALNLPKIFGEAGDTAALCRSMRYLFGDLDHTAARPGRINISHGRLDLESVFEDPTKRFEIRYFEPLSRDPVFECNFIGLKEFSKRLIGNK